MVASTCFSRCAVHIGDDPNGMTRISLQTRRKAGWRAVPGLLTLFCAHPARNSTPGSMRKTWRVPAKARLPSARAACLARAPLRLTDTSGPAQTSETSQTARGLSAPVGGRALGLRSEGSWLAAELCAPGSSPAQLTAVQVGRAIARPARTAFNSAGLEPGAQQLSCKPAAL